MTYQTFLIWSVVFHFFLILYFLLEYLIPQQLWLITSFSIRPIIYNTISGNIISTISDHFPQFLILNNYIRSPNTINKSPKCNWKKFNEKTFLSDISQINWDNTLDFDANDVNKSFNNFYNRINCLVDLHAPLIKPTNKKKEYYPTHG